MKLYYATGACSLACRISLHEAGIAADFERVDLKTKITEHGRDYRAINPKGYVPMLEISGAEKLTEAAVLLQYIADRKPGELAPVFGTMERYRLMEWLNFIATEVHKGFSPLWHPEEIGDQAVAATKAKLGKRLAFVESQLARTPFLTGNAFTIADAYLFTVASWSGYLKVDISGFPHLVAYLKRIAERPAVVATLAAERKAKQPA